MPVTFKFLPPTISVDTSIFPFISNSAVVVIPEKTLSVLLKSLTPEVGSVNVKLPASAAESISTYPLLLPVSFIFDIYIFLVIYDALD